MKVYFEETGCTYENGKTFISIDVYVKPNKKGYGYMFDNFGKLYKFYEPEPEEAKIFDSKDLPEELWYSITHGTNTVFVSKDKQKNWKLEDLEYDKVEKKTVKFLKKLELLANNITSIDDVKNICKLIKRNGYYTANVQYKIMRALSIQQSKIINGESGISIYLDSLEFKKIIDFYTTQ